MSEVSVWDPFLVGEAFIEVGVWKLARLTPLAISLLLSCGLSRRQTVMSARMTAGPFVLYLEV